LNSNWRKTLTTTDREMKDNAPTRARVQMDSVEQRSQNKSIKLEKRPMTKTKGTLQRDKKGWGRRKGTGGNWKIIISAVIRGESQCKIIEGPAAPCSLSWPL
jgi:hypothetical protein